MRELIRRFERIYFCHVKKWLAPWAACALSCNEFFYTVKILSKACWISHRTDRPAIFSNKKFARRKKKIHCETLVTFNSRVTGSDMFIDYFLVF